MQTSLPAPTAQLLIAVLHTEQELVSQASPFDPPEKGSGTLRIAVLCSVCHYFLGVLMTCECSSSGYYIIVQTHTYTCTCTPYTLFSSNPHVHVHMHTICVSMVNSLRCTVHTYLSLSRADNICCVSNTNPLYEVYQTLSPGGQRGWLARLNRN